MLADISASLGLHIGSESQGSRLLHVGLGCCGDDQPGITFENANAALQICGGIGLNLRFTNLPEW